MYQGRLEGEISLDQYREIAEFNGVYHWDLKKIHKCKGAISSTWKYCPWCGEKLK